MPDSLEQLDLLLVMAVKTGQVRRDGIRFQGLLYTDPPLATFVGETVSIRYDPREITELHVFHRDRFLCRAVSVHHAHQAISLKDIQQARTARRKARNFLRTLRRSQALRSKGMQSRTDRSKS